MSRKTLIVVGLSLLLVAATASALVRDSASDGRSATVLLEDFVVATEAPGKLEAALAFEIGPPSVDDFWEYNLEWMIPEGSAVSEGDVVARFDATNLDERLREHRAKLETVLEEKEKEQRQLEVALKELRLQLVEAEGKLKTVDLDLALPEGMVAFIELEQARLEKKLAEQRVAFLREKIGFEKQLVDSKLELLDVKRAYEEGKIAYNESVKAKFSVKAPVSGLVVYIPKRNGDRWEVGEGVWMLAKIMEIADVTTLQVKADILEVDAARIEPGQAAEIQIDALPGLLIESNIQEIGRIVHERSVQDRSKVFDAILPLPQNAHDSLRPGMGVQIRIELDRLSNRLTVPVEAVRNGAEGPYVEIAGSAASHRPVRLGPNDGRRVVVTEGLEEGDTVLLGSPS